MWHIKGMVHPKILSSFTDLYVVPNLHDFFLFCGKTKKTVRCYVKTNNICLSHLHRPTINKNNADVRKTLSLVWTAPKQSFGFVDVQ